MSGLDVTFTSRATGSVRVWHSDRTDEAAAIRQGTIALAEEKSINTDAIRLGFAVTVGVCSHVMASA